MTRKFFVLLLALSLLAGCGTAAAPSSPETSSPSSVSTSMQAPPTEPETVLPQEDPENPGNLAGAVLYYTPGNRLTLYAMEPETGKLRVVRENAFWNGREVESVSPLGKRLLLSSWDGAPSRKVVALSLLEDIEHNSLPKKRTKEEKELLLDIRIDTLHNLERTIEDMGIPTRTDGEIIWEEKHWFPGAGKYSFVDEDTFYYLRPCYREDPERPHLHRYDIGENGTVTASFLELECPDREHGWEPDCILLPEKGEMLTILDMGADSTGKESFEWLTWDIDTGKLLSRTPANNVRGMDHYLDGMFYAVESDSRTETFALTAYHMDTDTIETLATGAIPRVPGMEGFPADTLGVFEDVWVQDIREGKFVLRSGSTRRYRETLWDPAMEGEIVFGELMDAPTFPVEDAAGYIPIFTISPEGEGLFLPLPQDLAEQYENPLIARPYPLARLPGGELLFLAKSMEAA